MLDFIIDLNPVIQALIATMFTWFITLLGAALVFFFKNVNKNIMDGMLGFAAGIMIAASFFSLLDIFLYSYIPLGLALITYPNYLFLAFLFEFHTFFSSFHLFPFF